MHHSIDRIIHTIAFDTPAVEHWLEQEIAEWKQEGSRSKFKVVNRLLVKIIYFL